MRIPEGSVYGRLGRQRSSWAHRFGRARSHIDYKAKLTIAATFGDIQVGA